MTKTSLLVLMTSLAIGCVGDDAADAGTTGDGGSTTAFFLPTGAKADNTAAPKVAVDAAGATHAVYPSYAVGGAYYAYCGAGCATAGKTEVVRFETDGTVINAMIALTSEGHPRILLSAFQKAYYGSCDTNCGDRASWTYGAIADKGIDQDITGDAFALDPQNRPRFVMHTHVAYLGIGQKDPHTSWNACDVNCTTPAGWTSSVIADDLWQGSTLRFDHAGVAKLATIKGIYPNHIVYTECAANCADTNQWNGTVVGTAFSTESDIVSVHPRAALALTQAGAPRLAVLAQDDAGKRGLIYLSCNTDCVGANGDWTAMAVGKNDKLGAGFGLALDKGDHPHIAFTFDYNIALATCDDSSCAGGVAEKAKFATSVVEASTDLSADQIFLNYNCTVGGWLFHDVAIAMTPDGHARYGYQARDVSVGGTANDGIHGNCVAGTDMTWSRLALR